MQTKLLHRARGGRTIAVAFDPGDEVMKGLEAVAKAERLTGAHFTAIGALSSVTLGFFDLGLRDYRRIVVDSQCEVVSLVGNVALDGDTPKIHAHAVVGLGDGATRGGHLLEGWVQPTLEVVVVETPRHLQRKADPATGLPLLDLKQ
jgi:predicted DNA-binding protein with PD1-like motif